MDVPDPSKIFIDESYFRLLLRRAEFHVSDSIDQVRIPKAIHDELVRDSREYYYLRQTLMGQGVSQDDLDMLAQGAPQDDLYGSWPSEQGTWFQKPASKPVRISTGNDWRSDNKSGGAFGAGSWTNGKFGSWPLKMNTLHDDDDASPLNEDDLEEDSNAVWVEKPHRKGARQDHTLLFSNLPTDITHKDITNVIRGGRIIDVWLRKHDRSCAVTFVDGAAEYLHWAKRNDIYIRSKRIEINWSDRQYAIPGHLQSKISNGHSRNLVIRNALGRLTEPQIREDMEHIHNLVLIALIWQGSDVYISTNSVDKATFARNCMLSRLPYKGLKIEWYEDECAMPLRAEVSRSVAQATSGGVLKRQSLSKSTVTNRFDLLNLDGNVDTPGDENTTDGTTSGGFTNNESRLSEFVRTRRSEASTVGA